MTTRIVLLIALAGCGGGTISSEHGTEPVCFPALTDCDSSTGCKQGMVCISAATVAQADKENKRD
jgi:hypothetical protein